MALFYVLWFPLLFSTCIGIKSFEAYRVLQYEKNQRPLGSSKSSVNNLIAPIHGDHDLGRNVGVIAIQHLTLELLQTLSYRRCQSLLIVLPNRNDNKTSSFVHSDAFYMKFEEIEHYLLTNSFDFSIFFAFNDNDIIKNLLQTTQHLFDIYGNKDIQYIDIENKLKSKQKQKHFQFDALMSPFSMHDSYQLQGSEASNAIHSVKFSNIFGRIESKQSNESNESNENERKYIVIAANHDSFGVVPNLAFGVNDNGSGITAIMCLMNLFHKLYEENGNEAYDLLFLLTAGGYTNYKGTTKWIEDNIQFGLKNIEMVLCIDSIGFGQDLYLYSTPSFMNADKNKKFKEVFENVARNMNIDIKPENQRIESDTRLNGWHHEEFSRNKLNSITISSKGDKYITWNGTSILDNIHRINLQILYRNIEYLGAVLMTLIYDGDADYSTHYINERYMNNYINYLNRIPRFGPYHHKSSYLKKLKSDFQINCHRTNVMQYPQNEIYEKYYSTDAIMVQVFYVKPYMFDLLFMITNLSYLLLFYILLNRPKTCAQFVDLFVTE